MLDLLSWRWSGLLGVPRLGERVGRCWTPTLLSSRSVLAGPDGRLCWHRGRSAGGITVGDGGVTVGVSGTTVLGCPPLLPASVRVDCRAAWSLSAAWPLSWSSLATACSVMRLTSGRCRNRLADSVSSSYRGRPALVPSTYPAAPPAAMPRVPPRRLLRRPGRTRRAPWLIAFWVAWTPARARRPPFTVVLTGSRAVPATSRAVARARAVVCWAAPVTAWLRALARRRRRAGELGLGRGREQGPHQCAIGLQGADLTRVPAPGIDAIHIQGPDLLVEFPAAPERDLPVGRTGPFHPLGGMWVRSVMLSPGRTQQVSRRELRRGERTWRPTRRAFVVWRCMMSSASSPCSASASTTTRWPDWNPRAHALVRLAALIALGASCVSYGWAVE